MARFGLALSLSVFTTVFLAGSFVVQAEGEEKPPMPPPPPQNQEGGPGPGEPPPGKDGHPKPLHGKPGPGFRDGREGKGGNEAMPEWVEHPEQLKVALEKMPEEQRKRFLKNLKEWQKLPPEQRTWLRNQEKMRREQRKKEFDRLLEENGITLDEKQREEFGRRFFEERRKIEETLRREMDERRKPMVKDAIERLKKEFAEKQSAAPEAAKPEPVKPESSKPEPEKVP